MKNCHGNVILKKISSVITDDSNTKLISDFFMHYGFLREILFSIPLSYSPIVSPKILILNQGDPFKIVIVSPLYIFVYQNQKFQDLS